MRHAETVTFGGSALDRAAQLRANAAELDRLIAEGNSKTCLIWRGKPLVRAETLDALIWLPLDHDVLDLADSPRVLLGRDEDGTLLFAHDISPWAPADMDETALASFFDTSEQSHPALPGSVFAELRRIMTRLSARDAELAATTRSLRSWHQTHRFCACCGKPTEITMAGWQRDCTDCNASHFPRTDPVVIMLITQGNSVLLGRSPGWPEGMYSLLAGFIEPGETIEAAVRREVFEEAGVHVGAVEYLSCQPWPFPSSLMIGCHGAALTREICIDPAEIEDAIWITREELLAAQTGETPKLLPARKGAIAQFLLQNWLADTLD